MPYYPTQLDDVFQALGDPTRRAVLERLCTGPAAASELARPFAMTLPSFMQHLRVLEDRGLVQSRKSGRVRIYELIPLPLKVAERWMADLRILWERPPEYPDTTRRYTLPDRR